MRIEELSVGDWVNVAPNGFSRITAVYITPMGEMVELQKGETYSRNFTEFIEPIPITPEILEKNGFEASEYSDKIFGYVEDRLLVQYSFANHSLDIRNRNTVDVYVKNVHELQHALRLAGVGKEIEL